jgi:hypothetical protein
MEAVSVSYDRIEHELALFVTNSGRPPEPTWSDLTIAAAARTVPLLVEVAKAVRSGTLLTHPMSEFTHESADELGQLLRRGSDKSSNHDYHQFYAWLLGPRRHEALNLFEVGSASNDETIVGSMNNGMPPGASWRAFRDFLPNARIFGADIDRASLVDDERIKTFWLDQTKPETFAALQMPPLDLVIDDGLHSPHANLATAAWALEHLAPRGHIVVEDVRESALPIWHVVSRLLPGTLWTSFVVRALGGFMFVAERLP